MRESAEVTVVIAAWNAEATLLRAVKSALAQTVQVEVVVVDDASTDGTRGLADGLARGEPRLRVLHQPRNAGPAAARNRGMAESSAPWITVLDADDFMEPGRLEILLRRAEAENAEFVADDIYKVDEAEPDGPRRRMWSEGEIGRQWLDAAGFVRANLSAQHGGRRELGFLKPLMSRAFLERHRLSYNDLRLGEDYVLYTAALIRGARFLLTDPAGYVAVVRPGSLSGSHPTEVHAALIAADRQLMSHPLATPEICTALRQHLMEQRKKWAWRRLIDAVRETDPLKAVSCFWAPPAVIADLLQRLAGDAGRRLRRRSS